MNTAFDFGSPEHRARVVAGIRALADLIETDLDIPVPDSVNAQYSMPGELDEDQHRFVREIAAHFNITQETGPGSYTLNQPGYATVQHVIATSKYPEHYWDVRYVIHGHREAAQGGESQ